MQCSAEEIDRVLIEVLGDKKHSGIRELADSLERICMILRIKIKEEVLLKIKKKLLENADLSISRAQTRQIVELLQAWPSPELPDSEVLDQTFRQILPQAYGMDTSNTIILGGRPNESQQEFKSIVEDMEQEVEELGEKTKNRIPLEIEEINRFIMSKKTDREKRIDELKDIKKQIPAFPAQTKTDTKCTQILDRITGIINKDKEEAGRSRWGGRDWAGFGRVPGSQQPFSSTKYVDGIGQPRIFGSQNQVFDNQIQNPNGNTKLNPNINTNLNPNSPPSGTPNRTGGAPAWNQTWCGEKARHLEKYEYQFNERMLSLLNELSSKLDSTLSTARSSVNSAAAPVPETDNGLISGATPPLPAASPGLLTLGQFCQYLPVTGAYLIFSIITGISVGFIAAIWMGQPGSPY